MGKGRDDFRSPMNLSASDSYLHCYSSNELVIL